MDVQETLARRLERAKKFQEQQEKEVVEKQKQQEMAAAAVATGGSVLSVAAPLALGTYYTNSSDSYGSSDDNFTS